MVGSRIVIVGKPGAGKTTLSRQLSERLSAPAVELDAICWQPGWVNLPGPEMKARVEEALPSTEPWVADGNYLKSCREVIWGRADTLIWLDYPLYLALWRVIKRSFFRITTREELWNGNRESIGHFLNGTLQENLFAWTFRMHRQHRREFPSLFTLPENSHLTVLRFRSPKETENWLRTLDGAEVASNVEQGHENDTAKLKTT
jgi:GTPase SAR1 family protein